MNNAVAGLVLSMSLLAMDRAWASDSLNISLTPDPANPPSAQMGDWLKFHSVIRNGGSQGAHGSWHGSAWYRCTRDRSSRWTWKTGARTRR
jgi:hypothetical protein